MPPQTEAPSGERRRRENRAEWGWYREGFRGLSRLSDQGGMVAMSGGSRPNQFCKCAIVGLRTTFYTL